MNTEKLCISMADNTSKAHRKTMYNSIWLTEHQHAKRKTTYNSMTKNTLTCIQTS